MRPTTRKPDFLIVGVGRCGTTSLFQYLGQHPEIYCPSIKEPKYFSHPNPEVSFGGPGDGTVQERLITTKRKYYSLFEQAEYYQITGEASSDYFYYWRYTIPRIKREIGDPRIVICLRQPAERAWSAYQNLRRDGREALSFQGALKAEPARLDEGWDWMWAYRAGSTYSVALKNFLESFSHVKVLIFDDMQKEPSEATREIYRFLGVSDAFQPNTKVAYSPGGQPRKIAFRWLMSRRKWSAYMIRRLLQTVIPRSLLERLTTPLLKREKLDNEVYRDLTKQFLEDIAELERLTGKNLSAWRGLDSPYDT